MYDMYPYRSSVYVDIRMTVRFSVYDIIDNNAQLIELLSMPYA